MVVVVKPQPEVVPFFEGFTAEETGNHCPLVLQRHIIVLVGEAVFPVTPAGLGLAVATPPGPVQPMLALFMGEDQEGEQPPHLRERERDQVGLIPPLLRFLLWRG